MTPWLILGLIVVLWVACGIRTAGRSFAYFQRHFPLTRKEWFDRDVRSAQIALVLGPLGMVGYWLCAFEDHGWLWPWSQKARDEAGL